MARADHVASFTDAWIETALPSTLIPGFLVVASFTDAWIETAVLEKSMKPEVVASFTDAWIETSVQPVVQIW